MFGNPFIGGLGGMALSDLMKQNQHHDMGGMGMMISPLASLLARNPKAALFTLSPFAGMMHSLLK